VNPVLYIRTQVLRVSQAELAVIAGVASQGTISKWESDTHDGPSLREITRIRAEVRKRKIRWRDGWLFDVPAARSAA
jgi:transcriptional regulator with XRE-family HTH domain